MDYILRAPEHPAHRELFDLIRQEAENMIGNSLKLKQRDSKIAEQTAGVDKEIVRLRQETENNRAYLAGLYQNLVIGVLTSAEYCEMKDRYSRKMSGAVERVRQLQERQRTLENQMREYFTLSDRLSAVDEDTKLSALLVGQVIERVTVNSSTDVSIQFWFVLVELAE